MALRGYKFCLFKAYFEKGYGLTSMAKYLIAYIGLANTIVTQDMKFALIMGLAYFCSCFFIGWVWYHFKLVEAEAEVGNRFNPFQREVREKLNI